MFQKIRILQFIHGLNTGGAETLVKNYALGLDKSRFDVTVLCISHYADSPYEKQLRDHGIKVIYICDYMRNFGKKGLFYKFWNHYEIFFQVRKWIHKLDPDIIHIHLSLNKYVKFAKPKTGTSLVYTQHFAIKRWEKSDLNCLQWLFAHYPTLLIAINDKMQQQLCQLFHTERVTVLNNGIDLSRYQNTVARKAKRREIGIPEDAFVVVHVGRFNAIKNHQFLVRVFCEIKKKKDNAFLLMIGSGEEEPAIIKLLQELGLSGPYKILHNRLDVPEILQAADVGIFPSISEGLGIAVIEMQAAGLPVLASTGVPVATKVSNLIRYMSLSNSAKAWSEQILKLAEECVTPQYINITDWDIQRNMEQLGRMYIDMVENKLSENRGGITIM